MPMCLVGSNDSQRGLSLLELLVVLLLLGILAVVIPSGLQHVYQNTQLKSAARSIAAALRHTGSIAASSGKMKSFILESVDHYYEIPGHMRKVDIPDFIQLDVTLPSRLTDEDSPQAQQSQINFYPDGSATSVEIKLSHRDLKYLIRVDWLTAKVAVSRGADANNERSDLGRIPSLNDLLIAGTVP